LWSLPILANGGFWSTFVLDNQKVCGSKESLFGRLYCGGVECLGKRTQ
jgi:hypothetical protein